MSTAKRVETVEIVLTLTLAEAKWLAVVVQNPFTPDEGSVESEKRSAIWHALDAAIRGEKQL